MPTERQHAISSSASLKLTSLFYWSHKRYSFNYCMLSTGCLSHLATYKQQADPILQSRKSDIHRHIAAIHSRGKAVQNLRINIEAQIDEAYKKAMTDIQQITEQKVNLICLLFLPLLIYRQLR